MRWLVAALIAGCALRVALAWPVYRYWAEADASLTGLAALRALDGDPPVFLNGVRIGAVGAWLAAGLFALFGAGRETLAAVAPLFGAAALGLGVAFLIETMGPRRAAVAAPLLAIPPPAVSLWAGMPLGYDALLAICAALLYAAARAVRRGLTVPLACALGLFAGLGFWTSLASLCVTVPAAIWVTWRRPREVRTARIALTAGGAWLLGSAPWWAFNLRHGFPSLRANFAASAAESAGAALDNLRFTLADRLPELLAWTRPLAPWVARPEHRQLIAVAVVAAWAVLLLVAARTAWRGGATGERVAARRALLLFAGLAAAVVLANSVTGAGSRRGETVRYLLPLALALPLVAAALPTLPGAHRTVARTLVGALVMFHLAGSFLPGHPTRRNWTRAASEDARFLSRLEAAGVGAVTGAYSHVYAYGYLSGRRILGIPFESAWDAQDVAGRLPASPIRWALVGRGAAQRTELVRCAPALLPAGRLVEVGHGVWAWSGSSPPAGASARQQFELLRSGCPALGEPPKRPRRTWGH